MEIVLLLLVIGTFSYIGFVCGVIYEGRKYEKIISKELQRSRKGSQA